MAKGNRQPAGVRYFGHSTAGSKGSKHPGDLGSGPNTTEFISGGESGGKLAKGGASKTPAGVAKHSGTEHYATVKHLNASKSGPTSKSGASATPAGVVKHGGGKV